MQSFSLLLAFGALAGLLLLSWHAPKKEAVRYIDASVWVLFAALIASRAVTVAVNWGYYASHLGEIFQVWLGGLSSIGALAGGGLAIFILAKWWKIPAGMLADTLLPLFGALAVTSWLGCWVDACAYGFPTSAWWALPARDEWGVLASRLPVQLLGAVLTLVLIWELEIASQRLPVPGLGASIGLFGISAIVFALSYLRADPSPIWQGLRLEAWGSIGLMTLTGGFVVVLLVRWKMTKQPIPKRRVT